MSIFRYALKIVAVVAVLGGAVALLAVIQLHWLAPREVRQAIVPTLSAPVELAVDSEGVLRIRGETVPDVAAAIGFRAAQQHLWQMEHLRLAARGRLSAVYGAETLAFDRLQRDLRLDSLAERMYSEAPPETRRWVEGYVAGINGYIDMTAGKPPRRFRLADRRPERWEPQDIWAIHRLTAWVTGESLPRAYLVNRLAGKIPADMMAELGGRPPAWRIPPAALPDLRRLLDVTLRLRRWLDLETGPYAAEGLIEDADGEPVLIGYAGRLGAGSMPVVAMLPEGEVAGYTAPVLPGLILGCRPGAAWALSPSGDIAMALQWRAVFPAELESAPLQEGEDRTPMAFRKAAVGSAGRMVPHVVYGIDSSLVVSEVDRALSRDSVLTLWWEGWLDGTEFTGYRHLWEPGGGRDVENRLQGWRTPPLRAAFLTNEAFGVGWVGEEHERPGERAGWRWQSAPKPGWWNGQPDSAAAALVQRRWKAFRAVDTAQTGDSSRGTDRGVDGWWQYPTVMNLLNGWVPTLRADAKSDTIGGAGAIRFLLAEWVAGGVPADQALVFWQVWQWRLFERLFGPWLDADGYAVLTSTPGVYREIFYRILQDPASRWYDDPRSPQRRETGRVAVDETFAEALAWLEGRYGRSVHRWTWRTVFGSGGPDILLWTDRFSAERPQVEEGLWRDVGAGLERVWFWSGVADGHETGGRYALPSNGGHAMLAEGERQVQEWGETWTVSPQARTPKLLFEMTLKTR